MKSAVTLAIAFAAAFTASADANYSLSAPASIIIAADAAMMIPSTAAATAAEVAGGRFQGILLTEQEGKTWAGHAIYSSDDYRVGEVVDFVRSADGKVIGMHADIFGFLGFGQTLVSLTTTQFELQGDTVGLTLTAAQAKALPAAKS